MSESDDTDVLLLIPPDFFLVHSDSDDSLSHSISVSEQRTELERLVVNDLVSHVNELESRISLIEGVRNPDAKQYQLHSYSDLGDSYHLTNNYIFNEMSDTSKKLGGSFDSLHFHRSAGFDNSSTPLKVMHHSFPSTPSSITYPSEENNYKNPRQGENDLTVRSSTPSEVDLGFSVDLPQYSHTPSKKSGHSAKHELMNEIDDFLHSVKKNSHNVSVQGTHHTNQARSAQRRLDLKGVERLLDEMEATEIEIYHKSQARTQNLITEENINPQKTTSLGENINTVPDLKLGVRKIFATSPSTRNSDKTTQKETTHEEIKATYLQDQSSAVSSENNQENRSPQVNQRTLEYVSACACAQDQQKSVPRKRLEFGSEAEVYNLPKASAVQKNPVTSERGSTALPYKNLVRPLLPNKKQFSNDFRRSPVKTESSGSTSSFESNRSVVSCIPNTKLPINRVDTRHKSSSNSAKEGDTLTQSSVRQHPQQFQNSATDEIMSEVSKITYPSRGNNLREKSDINRGGRLVSLTDFWGSEEILTGVSSASDKIKNPADKLEEERLRRQHCERQILQLQAQLLEAQQKLSVAWEVDRAKDKAIFRLEEACNKLISHWKEVEEQRNTLSRVLSDTRESFRKDMSESKQILKRYENELSKMIDLARDYKEKCEATEKEKESMSRSFSSDIATLRKEIEERDHKFLCACQDIEAVRKEKEDLIKELVVAHQNIEEIQNLNKSAQEELQEARSVLSNCEAELLALKEEKSTLQLKLKEEKNRIAVVEHQKQSLISSAAEAKKKEKSLQNELEECRGKIEKLKVELRDYYQKQVEDVVKEKLKEFQSQLDAAETSFKNDLDTREKAVADLAAQQIKEISDKHQLEMRLLEEKHLEKQQLLKLQLNQVLKQASQLQSQVDYFTTHRNEIVEKLHAMMESQWHQAMGILTNSGINTSSHKCQASQQMYESDSQKVQMIPGTQHSHSCNKEPTKENATKSFGGQEHTSHFQHSVDMSSNRTNQNLNSEGREVTCHVTSSCDPTQNLMMNRGNELRKYIEMLLERPPGNPVSENQNIPTTEYSKGTQWKHIVNSASQNQQVSTTDFDMSQTSSAEYNKDNRSSKRPWR